MKFYVYKKVKICTLKLLKGPTEVLVLSSFSSSNISMLVNTQGKYRQESEFFSCGGPWAVDMSCMLFCPHVFVAMPFWLSQYFKIIQGWSTVIWISTKMECGFVMDVELHCVVKCGILEVEMHINDRWVQKQINKFK